MADSQPIHSRKCLQDKPTIISGQWWCLPDKPSGGLIDLIHRKHDGYVAFSVKPVGDKGPWMQLASLPAACLDGVFQQMVDTLASDSFFSLQGFWRGDRRRNQYGWVDAAGKPLPGGHRAVEDLRWLTCCAVDVDCWAAGLSVGEVIGRIIDEQDRGTLRAPPNVILRSGRGVWLIWLLNDEHGRPIAANPRTKEGRENLEKWNRVQTRIADRFRRYGGDRQARDAARSCRVPGSINTKTAPDSQDRRVNYWLQPAAPYDLEALALEFGADLRPRRIDTIPALAADPVAESRPPKGPPTAARQRAAKGQVGRWVKAWENFATLWRLRGRWQVGTRNAAAYVGASILSRLVECNRVTMTQAQERLGALWADIEQPPDAAYADSDFRSTIAAAFRCKRWTPRNQTIADQLRVTPEEAAQLPSWPPSGGGVADPAAAKLSRAETADRRRQLIRQLMDGMGRSPTVAMIAEYLAENGLGASPSTIVADLAVMGLSTGRRRRPRRADTQPPLFDPPPSASE